MLGIATLAILIFIFTYVLIITELVNKTTAALLGALLAIFLGVLDEHEALAAIDFATIVTVIGILTIVAVVRRSGLFNYFALKAVKLTHGNPRSLMALMCLLSFAMASIINAVTTIIILGSLTVLVCRQLKISLPPYLMAEALMADIGGAMFPISSIPNIMVSTTAKFGFSDFFANIVPLALILVPISTVFFIKYFDIPNFKKHYLYFDENEAIKDRGLFIKSGLLLLFIMLVFVFGDRFGLSIEVIAIGGAVLALLLSGMEPESVLKEMQWGTIFFFVGLFIVIGGLEKAGALAAVAKLVGPVVASPNIGILAFLSITGIFSGVLDEVSLTAAVLPIIKGLAAFTNPIPLYWALIVAANIGGNATPIGAVSSVLAMGIARAEGTPIEFKEFLKVGLTLTAIQMAISGLYLLLMF